MLTHRELGLSNNPLAVSKYQSGFQQSFQSIQPQFLKAGDHGQRPRVRVDIGECRTSPKSHGTLETELGSRHIAFGHEPNSLLMVRFEFSNVEFGDPELEQDSTIPTAKPVLSEQGAE